MADTRRKTKPQNNTFTNPLSELAGKIPPQAIDMEQAVLGGMMLEKNAPGAVIDVLNEDMFYDDRHRAIFLAIRTLFDNAQPIDILTVTEKLRSTGELDMVGGAYAISQLTNRVSSAANIEYHAHIISEKFIQRQLIKVSGQISKDAFEAGTDVFELLDRAEQELFAIKDGSIRRNYVGIEDILTKAIKQIESLKDHENGLTGIPSGFTDLDRITSGWQKSDLVILAARPGMGKTAFVLSIARNAAVQFNKPVAIFSLEMSSVQLVTRLISGEAELEGEKLKTGKLKDYEWEQLNTKVAKLSQAPLFIDDTPALSIFDLKAKCRRLKSQHGVEMIIIDYLQLMRGDAKDGGNREQEISYISRSLKGLAKDLDLPVIALSQLSREVEKRHDKKPILSDLRESGSIEQDADMVMFIYRPEYYNITQDESGTDLTGMAELIIAKHRNGPIDTARVRFIAKHAKFADYDYNNHDFSFDDYDSDSGTISVGSKMNNMDTDEDTPAPF